jgi:hypothetical protein
MLVISVNIKFCVKIDYKLYMKYCLLVSCYKIFLQDETLRCVTNKLSTDKIIIVI